MLKAAVGISKRGHAMFHATRVLWIVNKHLSAVLYENGERDPELSGIITAKEVLGDGELDFVLTADVYRRRSKKEAAFMVLIETASAWHVGGNYDFTNYCLLAAQRLLYIFHAEADPESKMMEHFLQRVAQRKEAKERRAEFISKNI